MLRSTVLATTAFALAASPLAAAEKPPTLLAKTTKWEINYDKEACHLLAKFGTGKEETIIRLTRYQPGLGFDLTLFGKHFDTRSPRIQVEIGFGLAPAIKKEVVAGTAANKLPLLIFNSLRLDGWTSISPGETPPGMTTEQEAQASFIDLTLPGKRRYRLETGSFAVPMQAMRDCVGNLVSSWGYDPAQYATMRQPPIPITSPATWVGPDDYPIHSVYQGQNGIVQFRLDIAPDGSVAGCHVLYRTNPDEFADLTCKLLAKRARFTPALDQSGAPVKSFYINKVRWMIPD